MLTEGLFHHKIRDISFTLVVDDLGIKDINKDDADHLNSIIREKYKYNVVDSEAKKYIGIHLDWDYENKRELICSMDGYVKQALQALREFTHTLPNNIILWPIKN